MIYVYPADAQGCGHYRLIWPALALRDQGHPVKVVPPQDREASFRGEIDTRAACPSCGKQVMPAQARPEGGVQIFRYLCNDHQPPAAWEGIGTIIAMHVPQDAEAIVVQRVSQNHIADGVKLLRESRPDLAVIVDMDDDLRSINPDNPAFLAMHKKWGSPSHNADNAMRACLHATLVTVSTPALLPIYAPHGRGRVLYNRVPAGYLDIPHQDSDVIGWPGSAHSHPTDLPQVGGSIARLVRDGHPYLAVGPAHNFSMTDGQTTTEFVPSIRVLLGLDHDPESTGSLELAQWPYGVARLGIGLAPLADTKFNAAKSWLKPLEMSAVGVPWVGSPRAEYARLHREHGAGQLARSAGDWYREVKRLATNEAYRLERSAAARAAARANTVEAHAWRWWEAWQEAIRSVQQAKRSRPAVNAFGL